MLLLNTTCTSVPLVVAHIVLGKLREGKNERRRNPIILCPQTQVHPVKGAQSAGSLGLSLKSRLIQRSVQAHASLTANPWPAPWAPLQRGWAWGCHDPGLY